MNLQFADGMILLIVALSFLMGMMRGLIREAFSLTSWLLSWLVARHFVLPVSVLLVPYVHTPSFRLLTAFALVFLCTWLVMSLLAYLVQSVLDRVGLRWSDRFLGAVFGLLRGLLIVEILLMLALPYASHDPWWHQSRAIGYFMHWAPFTRDLGRQVEAVSSRVWQ